MGNMFYKLIKRIEDPNNPLLGPNIWILKKAGLILPKNTAARYAYIFIYQLVNLFVISQYIEAFFIRNDLNQFLANLKISMLSIVCILKSNIFIFCQEKWLDIIAYVTEADIWERRTEDGIRREIINKYTAYSRKLLNFYLSLIIITGFTVFTTPLLKYITSSDYREALRNGTELFPHICSSWVPFDKYHSPGSWVTVGIQLFFGSLGAVILSSLDPSVFVCMVFVGGKFTLLKERCKQIFDGKDESDVFDRIKNIHDDHVLLLKYSRKLNSLFSPVMFCYVVVCSLMLCVTAFEITSTSNPAQVILTFQFLIFGVAQLYIFCWHSHDVLVKSENVSLGVYESKWYNSSPKERRYIHMLAGQLRIVHVFTAGPFTGLTLNTFINIVKGAYSYYTLLK